MARSVRDLVLLDGVITGNATTAEAADLSGVRLGLPASFVSGLDPETAKVFEAAIGKLKDAGATVVEMELPGLQDLNAKVGFPLALWEVEARPGGISRKEQHRQDHRGHRGGRRQPGREVRLRQSGARRPGDPRCRL